jgi:hypothetical protein
MDYFVEDIIKFNFLDRLEVFFEHLIQVEYKSLRSSAVLVNNIFESEFDRKFDLGVLLHSFGRDLHDAVSKLD